jgi:hypothetical protein
MDYQGKQKKNRPEIEQAKPEKTVERVTSGEVIVTKKTFGRKVKDLLIEADFRGVLRYIGREILVPAAKNMIVDSTQKGVERVVYGETAVRRRTYGGYGGTRVQYNSPISRQHRDVVSREVTSILNQGPRPTGYSRRPQDAYILTTREEAELVIDQMNDIIDNYEVASVADLHATIGLNSTHVDEKWGWTYLGNIPIRQIRDGFLLELPMPEPIE